MNRGEVRILDVRWRPDGTGRQAFEFGHIPGAVHLDWRTDLIDPSDNGDALLLAGPEQVANGCDAILQAVSDPEIDPDEYDRERAERYARREGLY